MSVHNDLMFDAGVPLRREVLADADAVRIHLPGQPAVDRETWPASIGTVRRDQNIADVGHLSEEQEVEVVTVTIFFDGTVFDPDTSGISFQIRKFDFVDDEWAGDRWRVDSVLLVSDLLVQMELARSYTKSKRRTGLSR